MSPRHRRDETRLGKKTVTSQHTAGCLNIKPLSSQATCRMSPRQRGETWLGKQNIDTSHVFLAAVPNAGITCPHELTLPTASDALQPEPQQQQGNKIDTLQGADRKWQHSRQYLSRHKLRRCGTCLTSAKLSTAPQRSVMHGPHSNLLSCSCCQSINASMALRCDDARWPKSSENSEEPLM